MSTVGYGDLTPTNAVGKVAAVLYLPLAVSALADAISDAGLIKLRRRIRETDYAADADVLLMREAARENDAHETLTEVRGRTSNACCTDASTLPSTAATNISNFSRNCARQQRMGDATNTSARTAARTS